MSRFPGVCSLLLAAGLPVAAAATELSYNRDIRPILVENCFGCHGADSASRSADLRLDVRDDAVESGAIVPGDPDSSVMLDRIFSDDPDEVMPPPHAKKTLTAEQKERLQRWIAAGAEYEPHWSFIPPRRPDLPAVKDDHWVRTPIDRFILARLEQEGLSPAPEADRRSLVRRVALDLTGLPPEPAVVEDFVADPHPDAYERLVDSLLASLEWGEHRGRHWLDYARYADTHGIHHDNYREMWTYRQWVVNAFNRNIPFDQFTILQLAGDLVAHDPGRTTPQEILDARIGSGFNRCNMTTSEGGAIPEEYAVLYTRDRTETTAAVWMGLTAGCAVCHNHKFDPLSQKEFYELAAFFNNTTQDPMDGNIHDTPPVLVVPAAADRDRWIDLQREVPAARERLAEARGEDARRRFTAWLAGLTPAAVAATNVQETPLLELPLAEGSGTSTKVLQSAKEADLPLTFAGAAGWQPGPDGRPALRLEGVAAQLPAAGDFEFDTPFTVVFEVKIKDPQVPGAIVARCTSGGNRRGWTVYCQDQKIAFDLSHDGTDDTLRVTADKPLPADAWTPVAVAYDGSGTPAGVRIFYDGHAVPTRTVGDSLRKRTVRNDVALTIGGRTGELEAAGIGLAGLSIWGRGLAGDEIERIALTAEFQAVLAAPAAARAEVGAGLFDWWLARYDEAFRESQARLAAVEDEETRIRKRSPVAHVMQEKGDMAKAHVLARGEYDKPGEEVRPDTPDILPEFPEQLPRNRLGLARWLLLQDHPLTARVTVNRFWQEVFGTGLVRSSGDFGTTGELPSHPELLDWLAIEFRESGWDVKQLFRLMVTSAAYRQQAATTPEKLAQDRDNRLLSRGPRFRLDAEMIRDQALAASGLLVRQIGGPSVKPYQPDGVWEAVAMIGSNTRDYKQDKGPNVYRRSMYWFWKRSAPPASLDIFNAPSRETCCIKRERTNTPLQALVTLNDPQFVETARALADRTLEFGGDGDDSRIDFLARRLLARPLTAGEATLVKESLAAVAGWYASHPDDAKQLVAIGESKPRATDTVALAAWTVLANELMNLDEFLCK